MSESSVDYDRLERAVAATINDLGHWFIHPSMIYFDNTKDTVAGGFGDVHRATLVFAGHWAPIAVKKLRSAGSWNQRLRVAAALARELRVWEKADHPNILRLVGFFMDTTTLNDAWLITWWQWEGDVLSYADRTIANEDRRLQLAQDTADGLTYLHGCNICHGDIKPANTLVNGINSKAMICDFGLSKIMEEVPSGLTTSRLHVGTVRYTSPELFMDDTGSHSFPSDVWAWGCLFFEVVTAIKPHQGLPDGPKLYKALTQSRLPAPLDSIKALDFVKRLLGKTWSIEPQSRPSVDQCAQFLRESISLWTWFRGTSDFKCPTAVLSEYMEELEGWSLIRNPATSESTHVSVLQTVQLPGKHSQTSPSFKYALVDGDSGAELYELATQKLLVKATDHYVDDDCDHPFSTDERLVLILDHQDEKYKIWDWARDTIVLEFECRNIPEVHFSDLDNTVLVWQKHSFQVWDTNDASVTLTIPYPDHLGRRQYDAVFTWKNHVAAHFHNNVMVVWDVVTGATVLQVPTSGNIAPSGSSFFLRAGVLAAVIKEGETNVEGSDDEDEAPLILTLWEVDGSPAVLSQPDKSPKSLRGPLAGFDGGDISTDKQLAVTYASGHGLIQESHLVLWDLTKDTALLTLKCPAVRLWIREVRLDPCSTGSSGRFVVISGGSGAYKMSTFSFGPWQVEYSREG